MLTALSLDQLRRDADAISGLAQTAFEHIAHAQLTADLLHADGAAPAFNDFGIDQLGTVRFQPCEGPLLVGADQPAVARDISDENGGQPAFDAFRHGHFNSPAASV